jgi:hypothetical protein
MTETKREWDDTVDVDEAPGLWLLVGDGNLGHATRLSDAAEKDAALEDYAAGYDAGGKGQKVVAEWWLYRDGEELDRGEWAFFSRR